MTLKIKMATTYKKIKLDNAVGGGDALEIVEEEKTTISKQSLLDEKARIEELLSKFD